MHGYGFYIYADKVTYEGQFVNDKKDGFGIYCWTDGRKYEGCWKKGKQHGLGSFTVIKNNVSKSRYGIWENGKRVRWFDDMTAAEINAGQYDYSQHFKDPANENPSAGCTFNRPEEWNEEIMRVRNLLNV